MWPNVCDASGEQLDGMPRNHMLCQQSANSICLFFSFSN